MKRLLVGILSSLLIALATAGIASGEAWFNLNTGAAFVGRGDVIAAAGKDALVIPDPMAADLSPFLLTWVGSEDWVLSCRYSDGSTKVFTYTYTRGSMGFPHARLAPGNGNITGYTYGPEDNLFWPDDMGPVAEGCSAMTPAGAYTVDGGAISHSALYDTHLYFGGADIPYTLLG